MRAVVQRVREATVFVDGEAVGHTDKGLLVLCGFAAEDDEKTVEWVANRIVRSRIFPDENGKLNKSLSDVGGGILCVSNFTLYADCKHGTRPDFSRAAGAEISKPLYETFLQKLSALVPTESGRFGKHMELSVYSDGPITVIFEK